MWHTSQAFRVREIVNYFWKEVRKGFMVLEPCEIIHSVPNI